VSRTPIAIVGGAGDLGFGLALRLTVADVPVTIGSRNPDRAVEAAARLAAAVPGAHPRGAANLDAVMGAEVVVLSVPFASQAATLKSIAGGLVAGQLLLDVTVPLAVAIGGRPTRVLTVWQGSAAQQAQELVPAGVTVVSGLHTVAAKHLADLSYTFDEDVLIAGDDAAAKAHIAAVLRKIPGLRPVDAGKLEMARIIEQLTALTIGINLRHKVTAGLRIVGLPSSGSWEPELLP
jgi:8-hydroxy-5-deazaflavin:NADPH oxidoreductase